MGYLGKISALVTANTGDFSRNLNAAAADVRKFAASVQNNITKASSDAERSFKAIYTPLQTLERSLKAASSMKLSFKGFDGAIRDINVLKERLTGIKGTQIDLILKASGLQTISQFREAIKDISNESFNFAIKFGGIDKLKLIREELRGVSATSINAVLSAGGLERLKELKETVAGLKGDQLNLALRVGGTETLTKVEQQAAGLTQKDMRLLLKVGGTENLDRIVEELAGVNSRSIDALVNVKGTAELDRVLEMFQNLSPEQIDAVIRTIGAQDLEAAVTKMQQLRSAAILVGEPLAAAAQKFSKLSIEAQAGFVTALNVSQTKVQELKQDIDDGVTIGTTRFKALEAQVLRTAEAIDRLGEAEALVGQVGNGRSFQFQRPLDREALVRASDSRAAALKLPGQALADNPEIASLQNRINGLANQYPRLQANLEAAKEAGADYSQQIAAIEKWRSHLLRLISAQEKQIAMSSAQGQSTPLPRFRGERSFIGDRIAAQRASQENAMFGEREAEVAAAQAAAARQRRARRETFADSLFDTPRRLGGRLFGGGENAAPPNLDQALSRTAELDAAYNRLSQTARASLQGQADELDRIARAARDGAAGVGVLADANDRMAASLEMASSPPPDRNEGRLGEFTSIRSVGARTDISDTGRSSSLEDRRRSVARQSLGFDLEVPARQMGLLQGRIVSLKNQLDSLPAGIRSELGPAIRAAEADFIRLSAAVNPVPEEIEQAAANLRNLENTARRLSAIDAFGKNFGNMDEFLSAARVREFSGEMEALRGVVAGARPSRARDAAARAAERLQRVRAAQLQLDEDERTSGLTFPDQRAALERQSRRAELVADARAGQAAGVSRRSVRDRRRRGGDVGRGGADNASLALNQLAFAVDDFMSSTGGLEFKLRAISNNITQMAFVLGGTTGLFIGLGAVLAGQVAVGLIKYLNNGRSAEDQTKALNDSLMRQKTLVEELAQAFESLGESLSQGTRSAAGERNADIERQIDDIRKKQRESRESAALDLDPEVQRERAEQNKLRKSLESETDIGSRTAIQSQIRSSQDRERRRSQEVLQNRPAAVDVVGAIERARGVVEFDRRRRTNADPSRFTPEEMERRRLEAVAGIDVAGPQNDANITAQRRALERQIADLADDSLGFGPEADRASEQRNQLEALLASLELPLREAVDDLAISVVEASRGPAEQIRQAQEEVAEAIKAGLPGARIFQLELDNNAKELEKATKKLAQVRSGKDEFDNKLSLDDSARMTAEAQADIATLEAQRRDIAAKTDAFAYERIVDPQRQIEARMGRAGANLNAAGLEDGRIARRMREIEAEREKIRRDSQMPENNNAAMQGFFEGREAALNEEVSAIEAATLAIKIFAAALDRASEEVKGNLNSAQQAADEARRADLGNSTPQTQEARRQAEADLESQREIERRAQTEIAVERDRLGQMQRPDAERLKQIDEELKSGREFDPGLAQRREELQADAAAADASANDSRQKLTEIRTVEDEFKAAQAEVNRSEREFDKALDEKINVRRDLGIPASLAPEEQDEQLRQAGRGDVVDAVSRAAGVFGGAEGTRDVLAGRLKDGAVAKAEEELAAASARQSQAAKALAEVDEKIAAAPSASREDLIRERADLQAKMEDDARTSQARIDAARDASTQEEEQRKSAVRGRGLARKPDETFREETEQGLADIQAYFERRAEANNGLRPEGDAEAQAAAEERFRRDREREARTATAAGRGRELGMTPQERFRRDMAEGPVADLTAAAKEMQAKGQDPTALLRQGIANQLESVAPMLQQFQEERQNALLQGPSRAAINVSDVSTTQGQSELNRLLRGDDSAKDVNLAELQKQTQKFDELIKAVQQANPGVLL